MPGFCSLLLHAEEMTLITLQEQGPTGNELEWNVELIPGYDREHENAAVALAAADINNNVAARHAAHATLTSFMPHGRLRIRLKNKNTVSGVNTALLSGTLVVVTAQQ